MYPYPLITLGSLKVYLYGVCIAVGILACLAVFYIYTTKDKMSPKLQDFIYFVAIFSIAIGVFAAMLFQGFYDYLADPSKGFKLGGLTVMGGIIGGAGTGFGLYYLIGKFYFKNKGDIHKKQVGKVLRVLPCCITIAHGFGRIGCLMAGCCYGRYLGSEYVFGGIWMKCDGVWGYYIPTQLYEALFLFVLFAVLTVLYFKKFNLTLSVYLIAYGIWRIIIEIFRADYRGGVGVVTPSQWTSILFIIGGIVYAVLLKFVFKKPIFIKEEQIETTKE